MFKYCAQTCAPHLSQGLCGGGALSDQRKIIAAVKSVKAVNEWLHPYKPSSTLSGTQLVESGQGLFSRLLSH